MNDDVNKILDERKKSHGDFSDHARITTSLKFTMQGEPGWSKLSPVQKECLDMIAHKIGRILAGDPDFKDHWDDIAGYATLVANRCSQPKQDDITELPRVFINAPATCKTCGKRPKLNAAGYVMCDYVQVHMTKCPYMGTRYREDKHA